MMISIPAPLAQTAARLALGALFLYAGYGKLDDVASLAGFIQSGGLPGWLAWPVIAFEMGLGAAMVLGFHTRHAALAGAAFCIATAFLFHLDPGNYNQDVQLLKNLGLAGAFLMLAVHGPGRFALAGR